MTTSRTPQKPKSLIGKALWILQNRPAAFLSSLRAYLLFRQTHFLMFFFRPDPQQVQLGKNVRIQSLRCIHAEKPDARIILGDHSIVYEKAHLGAYGTGKIQLGSCAVLGDIRIASRYSVTIGERFISSWNVFIQDFDPHPIDPIERGKQIQAICSGFRPRYSAVPYPEQYAWSFPGEAISIGNDVWIGANATILKGAHIGDGCIVATGAVVLAGSYPAKSILAGSPAKVVKSL